MAFSLQNFTSLIKVATENNASDIHIRSNESPSLRINNDLIPVQSKPFSTEDVEDIIKIITTGLDLDLDQMTELDGGMEIESLCRIRYNIFKYNHRFGVIIRLIKLQVPTIDQLNLPKIIKKISETQRGLILVTGATGSGKSTTLSAMIDHMNKTRASHIITLEDPIEYIHTNDKSRVTQREIGVDTPNFTVALRSALRQDPDIIFIGEMRDAETVSTALKAAETGHLVLSTVHTTNAISTLNRVISMFPPQEQEEIKKRLATSLMATVSQRMLKANTKSGITIAQEIMLTSPGIRECILGEEPLSRVTSIIREGKGRSGNGAQSFDQHIMELYNDGKISKETALGAVDSQSDFLQMLDFD